MQLRSKGFVITDSHSTEEYSAFVQEGDAIEFCKVEHMPEFFRSIFGLLQPLNDGVMLLRFPPSVLFVAFLANVLLYLALVASNHKDKVKKSKYTS